MKRVSHTPWKENEKKAGGKKTERGGSTSFGVVAEDPRSKKELGQR